MDNSEPTQLDPEVEAVGLQAAGEKLLTPQEEPQVESIAAVAVVGSIAAVAAEAYEPFGLAVLLEVVATNGTADGLRGLGLVSAEFWRVREV